MALIVARRLAAALLILSPLTAATNTARGENRYNAALLSITAGELHEHVATLADDIFEGRRAGSRGGHAAANFVVHELEHYELQPAGDDGTYFQPFADGYRNVLALLPGSDPDMSDQVVVVSAHYDHVGYGDKKTSFGPIGFIHNGADDNASGVSGLLEAIEALHSGQISLRRSVLFAFWDGEELGLVGSKHWVANSTLPLDRVRLMLNVDMIGWMREGRLELVGSRTGYGLRQLLGGSFPDAMWLDFTWKLDGNTDHWPFFKRGIPVVTLHTGLHEHYHRPTDDVERINDEGLQLASRYLFELLVKTANADQLPRFRAEAEWESPAGQRELERQARPNPPRIGISWQASGGDPDQPITVGGLLLTRVVPGSPAESAGLRAGDRLLAVDGNPIDDVPAFQQELLRAATPVMLTAARPTDNGEQADSETIDFVVEPAGAPIRLGVSWRSDEADPGGVLLSRVVPGSPAAMAGLVVADRIYSVDGHTFVSEKEFGQLVTERLDAGAAEIQLAVETRGHARPVTIVFNSPPIAENTN